MDWGQKNILNKCVKSNKYDVTVSKISSNLEFYFRKKKEQFIKLFTKVAPKSFQIFSLKKKQTKKNKPTSKQNKKKIIFCLFWCK